MEPVWEIWKDSWLEFFYWTPAGGSGTEFDWKFWNGSWLGGSEGFLFGTREGGSLGGGQMGMWSGGPKEDATWSNGQDRAW